MKDQQPKDALAALMKEAREKARGKAGEGEMTQLECGLALGVTQTSISRFEGGESLPSVSFLRRFVAHFKLNVDSTLDLLRRAKEQAAADQIRREIDAQ